MTRWTSVLVAVTAMLVPPAPAYAAEPEAWESERGLFRVRFESSIEPIVINRIHEWIVTVESATGAAIDDAAIVITGGMPEHDHGLPTAPRVTAYLGDGRYRVQGLRFHMTGAWLIEMTIDAAGRSDTVAISLAL